jgi:acetyltransferase-like isoleucine patch superfamily enzyme
VGQNIHVHASGGSFERLTIGDGTHIGKGVLLDLSGRLTIGDRVGIGMFARILSHQNLGDSRLSGEYPPDAGDVTIPNDAVISSGSWLLYPTTIAEGTLISANSVVRGHYPSPCLLIGNPARVAQRFQAPSEGPREDDVDERIPTP